MVEVYGTVPSIDIRKDIASQDKKTVGLGYPLTATVGKGYFSKQSGEALVIANLHQLLSTDNGERVMLPSYGTKIRDNLFAPLDRVTFEEIKTDIVESLAKFAPGVILLKLQVFEDERVGRTGSSTLTINLVVKIKEIENKIIEVPIKIG